MAGYKYFFFWILLISNYNEKWPQASGKLLTIFNLGLSLDNTFAWKFHKLINLPMQNWYTAASCSKNRRIPKVMHTKIINQIARENLSTVLSFNVFRWYCVRNLNERFCRQNWTYVEIMYLAPASITENSVIIVSIVWGIVSIVVRNKWHITTDWFKDLN